MAKAELCVGHFDVKGANIGVTRAEPHRPLRIPFGLLEAAERVFGDGACREEHKRLIDEFPKMLGRLQLRTVRGERRGGRRRE